MILEIQMTTGQPVVRPNARGELDAQDNFASLVDDQDAVPNNDPLAEGAIPPVAVADMVPTVPSSLVAVPPDPAIAAPPVEATTGEMTVTDMPPQPRMAIQPPSVPAPEVSANAQTPAQATQTAASAPTDLPAASISSPRQGHSVAENIMRLAQAAEVSVQVHAVKPNDPGTPSAAPDGPAPVDAAPLIGPIAQTDDGQATDPGDTAADHPETGSGSMTPRPETGATNSPEGADFGTVLDSATPWAPMSDQHRPAAASSAFREAPPHTSPPTTNTATQTLAPAETTATAITPSENGGIAVDLSSEDLGNLRMEITRTGEKLHVAVAVERPDTADLARRHAAELVADLRQSGYTDPDLSFAEWGGQRRPSADPSSETAQIAQPGDLSLPQAPPQPTGTPSGHLDIRI